MRAASTPALRALSRPTAATGTPGGICSTERIASSPPAADRRLESGTPITGRSVCAATTPGSAADRPAPAISTRKPARAGVARVLGDLVGLAVRREHAHLVADAALLELGRGRAHRLAGRLRAHQDADQERRPLGFDADDRELRLGGHAARADRARADVAAHLASLELDHLAPQHTRPHGPRPDPDRGPSRSARARRP